MHHADAGGDGVARRADRHRPPVDEDLAAVGLVEAVEDAHQRRLAGAVLADDAVDGSGPPRQAGVAVRMPRAAETGRAWGRRRACLSGEMTGGADALKKNKT